MGDSKTYIENSIIANGGRVGGIKTNTPIQYADRQRQYYAERNKAFVKARAKYASDYVLAEVQGIDDTDFYRYFSTHIRLSDTASLTYSASKNTDDVKLILFDEPKIDYFPIGAKVKTMGSTWICTNPCNLSDVSTQAIIQRCNAAYCLYDYYGNIITEPIVVEKATMQSNDNNAATQNLVLMEGYFNIIAQKNEYTDLLGLNQRIILGKYAYYITGFTDFIQEFTGDYDSVHLYRFSARIEEPTENDNLVNHIANGKNYSFSAIITGTKTLGIASNTDILDVSLNVDDTGLLTASYPDDYNGATFALEEGQLIVDNISAGTSIRLENGAVIVTVNTGEQLYAHFIKNGKEVVGTEEYPVTWTWTSSDPEIATVTPEGLLTGNSAGEAIITATMVENPLIQATTTITVKEADLESRIEFIGVIPTDIEQYESATVTAGFYDMGVETDAGVTYTFSGANERCYSVSQDGNTLTITCLQQSDTPLTITAAYGGYTASVDIVLEAY